MNFVNFCNFIYKNNMLKFCHLFIVMTKTNFHKK